MRSAIGSISLRDSITSVLYGTVIFIPTIPSSKAPFTAVLISPVTSNGTYTMLISSFSEM